MDPGGDVVTQVLPRSLVLGCVQADKIVQMKT